MKVACVLITHFPMKAALKRHPQLRGRQVIIAQVHGSRRVVLDSSPETRGVATDMPLQEALSRCKAATLLEADESYYEALFARLYPFGESRKAG